MVHYTSPSRSASSVTDYWKIPRQEDGAKTKRLLEDNGIAFTKSSSRDRLAILHSRFQRGLLCYGKCKVSKLRAFCKVRGLVLPPGDTRIGLISTLELADEDKTFDKFLALPTELRVDIYKLHLQEFHTNHYLPVQPPLLRVSRLVRRESFDLFHQLCQFEVSVDCAEDRPSGSAYWNSLNRIRNSFFRAASVPTIPQGLQNPPQPLGHLLTRLRIRTTIHYRSASGTSRQNVYDVHFEIRAGRLTLTIDKSERCSQGDYPRADAELHRRAERLLELFRDRGRVQKAVADDDKQAEEDREGGGEEVDDQTEVVEQCSKLMLEDTDVMALELLSFGL